MGNELQPRWWSSGGHPGLNVLSDLHTVFSIHDSSIDSLLPGFQMSVHTHSFFLYLFAVSQRVKCIKAPQEPGGEAVGLNMQRIQISLLGRPLVMSHCEGRGQCVHVTLTMQQCTHTHTHTHIEQLPLGGVPAARTDADDSSAFKRVKVKHSCVKMQFQL